MADVIDRGQLILVTGLVLAVTLVVLSLLLNTVIYTENLASRGTDTVSRDAIEFQGVVVDDVGSLIDEENRQRHDDATAVTENVTDGLYEFETIIERRYAERGVIAEVNVSSLATDAGHLIAQPVTQELRSESNDVNWTVATGVDDTRGFTMTLDRTSLTQTVSDQAADDGAFYVNLTDVSSSQESRIYVYENSTSNELEVAVGDGTGANKVCSVGRPEATIDLTTGTLDGRRCPGLDWADTVTGDHDIRINHGNNASGSYELFVNGTANVGSLNDGTSTSVSPYFVPAVYSATLDIGFRNADLRYEATVRIVRGEPT